MTDKGRDKKPKKAYKNLDLAADTETPLAEPAETKRILPQKAQTFRSRRPVPQDIKISARQFIRARQFRWERSAGFLIDMKRKHGPEARLTRPEWDTHWAAFWARPVR